MGYGFFGFAATRVAFDFEPLGLGSMCFHASGSVHMVMASAPALARFHVAGGASAAEVSVADVKQLLTGLQQDQFDKMKNTV
jgi:hypothetical protein